MNLQNTTSKLKQFAGIIAVFTSGFIATRTTSAANLIADGSFEGGPGGATTLYAGSLLLPGWSILGGSIDSVGGGNWQAADGTKFVDLDGFRSIGAIAQTVNVQNGQSYLLSFALAGNPDAGPTVKQMGITWGNSSLGTFTFDITGKTEGNMGWVNYQMVVPATASQMTLTFTSLDAAGNSWGPMLDNVSLTPVPEPQPTTLFGFMLIVTWCIARRSQPTDRSGNLVNAKKSAG